MWSRKDKHEMKAGRKNAQDQVKEVSMGLAASLLVESRVGWLGRMGNVPFLLLIRVYRVVLSPVIGGQCRFEPTCSVYSMEAYRLYGPVIGTRMTAGRICRCHPWNSGGFDPVRIPGDVEGLGIHDVCSELGIEREGDEDGATAGRTEA